MVGREHARIHERLGTFELARTPFIATVVGSLLVGALLYNLPAGVVLRRLTVHRDP